MNKDREPVKVFIPKNPRKYSEGFEVVIYSSVYQIPFREYTGKTIFILESIEDWVHGGTIHQRWWKKNRRTDPLNMLPTSKIPKSLKAYSLLV